MTALERLSRLEQRESARFWFRHLWPFLLGLACFVFGFGLGVRHNEPAGEDRQIVQALQDVSDSLKVVRARADSLRHVDSVRTARFTASLDSVRAHQPRVDSAIDAATAAKPSVVVRSEDLPPNAVEGPATALRAWVVLTDTAWNVPLPVARQMSRSITAVEEAKDQLHISAVALHDAQDALATKTARVTELEHAESLAKEQDSLHVEHERKLEKDRDGAFRRGVRTGVVGTVKVLAVVVTAAKIVAVARR